MSSPAYSDADLRYRDSTLVAATPASVYGLICDVARMGEWSPVCAECWWDDGAGPRVGAWFTGRNVSGEMQWETRCRVTAADVGREFSFVVGEGTASWVSWSYDLAAESGGTRLTESWEFLPAGVDLFHQLYPDTAEAEILDRITAARTGIPATLAAIKAAAENAQATPAAS